MKDICVTIDVLPIVKDVTLNYIQNRLIYHLTPNSDECCEWPCDVAEALLTFDEIRYIRDIYNQSRKERYDFYYIKCENTPKKKRDGMAKNRFFIESKPLFIGDIKKAILL